MKRIIILCTLFMVLFSCTKQKEVNQVTIKGKLLTANVKEVKFEWIKDNPINDKVEEYSATVDSLSQFSITIPIHRLATGNIIAGNSFHRICFFPGDNINIEIEADTIKYTGKGAEKNNFLYATEVNHTSIDAFYYIPYKVDLTPTAFLVRLKEFKQKRLNFLDSYAKNQELEPEYINYYKIQTQVIYEKLIRSYPELYAYTTNTPLDSLKLPEEYTKMNQLSQIVDDRKIITEEYNNNLQQFLYTKRNEVMKADTSIKRKEAIYILLFDSLKGKTQEYILARWLCQQFLNNKYDTIAYNKFQKITKDDLSTTTVKESFDKFKIKEALIGQPLHHAFVETMVQDTTNTTLSFGDMMNKFKGKVVYLDIWSLDCGPCRGNMPHSKKLKERLTGLPIEFVYIAQDAPFNNVWKRIFDVSLTRENQYLMVNYKWGSSEMLKFMEINWVPCYMIFDKKGNLIDFNADGPYDLRLEEKLKELAGK